ncbi:MAG: hypothetical protein KBD76_01645 [Bacteriovorax sp.]|jgi:hypothetical protein|nr:hypothetical protein [Bacteriovorax sp.]
MFIFIFLMLNNQFISTASAGVRVSNATSYNEELMEMKPQIEALSDQANEAQLTDAVWLVTNGLAMIEEDAEKPNCDSEKRITEIEKVERTYVVVGVSGFMTKENGGGQPSGVHDNLPENMLQITGSYKIAHSSNEAKLDGIIKNLNCDTKKQPQRPGLIIMINSWGAKNGYRLAKKCINYYQTRSFVHGRAMDNCENIDMSNSCSDGGVAICHIEVEWYGSAKASKEIKNLISGN